MPQPRITPALADLAHDIANGIPTELVVAWATGERSEARASALLEPHRVEGTVAVSDTVGLSRMSQERPLAEVLSMISRPKEIIHALGCSVGGQPIGRWVADNSEMLYPPSVAVDEVVAAMLAVHRHVPAEGPKIGLCIHPGTFFHLGEGLYGSDAALVEQVAESASRGGETLLSAAGRAALRAPARFRFRERRHHAGQSLFAVEGDEAPRPLPPHAATYPIPYDEHFYRSVLLAGDEGALSRYEQVGALLLITTCPSEGPGLAVLLNELLGSALLALHFRQALGEAGVMRLKSGGRLGIAALPDAATALQVARATGRALAAQGVVTRAGIDIGPFFRFPMPEGRWEFAGDPVNIASKLAEDCGTDGCIYLSERAAEGLPLPNAQPRRWQRSALELRAWELR